MVRRTVCVSPIESDLPTLYNLKKKHSIYSEEPVASSNHLVNNDRSLKPYNLN